MTSGSQRGTEIAIVPPGRRDPDQLPDGVDVGVDVLEHLGGHDAVELAVGERQRQGVTLLDVGLGALGDLALLLHRAEDLQHPGQLVGVHVERHHVGAAPVGLEGVPAPARAHVEQALAGAQAEPVEVNGEH